jgi:hypothetical protein
VVLKLAVVLTTADATVTGVDDGEAFGQSSVLTTRR